MVDPNRKINRLTEKDIEFLSECESEFKDRFSPDDEEFMNYCKKEPAPPPIIDPWNSFRKYGGGHHGQHGYHGQHRDNYRGRKFYHHRGNYGRKPYSYDGHSSGYGGR